jgi:hypothetical protein
VFTVELVEEKTRGCSITRLNKKISVSGAKAPSLQLFDLMHGVGQAGIMGLLTQMAHTLQVHADLCRGAGRSVHLK